MYITPYQSSDTVCSDTGFVGYMWFCYSLKETVTIFSWIMFLRRYMVIFTYKIEHTFTTSNKVLITNHCCTNPS